MREKEREKERTSVYSIRGCTRVCATAAAVAAAATTAAATSTCVRASINGETTDIYKRINSKEESILWRNRKLPDDQLYLQIIQDLNKQAVNIPRLHYGVTHSVNSELTSNGPYIPQVAPNWALSYNYLPWNYEQELVARCDVQDTCNLSCKKENKLDIDNVTKRHINRFKDLSKSKSDNTVLDSEKLNVSRTADFTISNSLLDTIQGHGGKQEIPWKGEKKKEKDNLINVKKKSDLECSFWQDQYRSLSEAQKLAFNANIDYSNYLSKYSQSADNTTLCPTSVHVPASYKSSNHFSSNSVKEVNKPLDLSVNATRSVYNRDKDAKIKERYPYLDLPAAGDKRTVQTSYPIITQTDFFCNTNDSFAAKYKELNDDLLKLLNLNNLSCKFKCDTTTQSNVAQENISTDIKLNSKSALDINLKQESKLFLDKYFKGRTFMLSHEKRGRGTNLNDRYGNIKEEYSTEELLDKAESIDPITAASKITLGNWEAGAMSGQYPGHSRPPVGTPPPQTVWNHLTMTQGQGNIFYGLNIHPSGLPGAALNPAGFYTHPSISRASHLTPQLTPQLAHTQAPPTWHTPTVPSKTVTPSNTPGNPLFSLQMLVDNRQNQNQYRNSPGSQNTLDLSATSDIIPENYSRIPQDIPISLTARNVDKGSRNGNIISPPIPLNGETSSDSGISSSVPTPNSVSEPVSLSTKEITTPKITVKNFESNLKGVANIHDKIKEISVDGFAQKVINLPPSVTIERVVADKKEPEITKSKDTLSVIAQVPRNVLPVIVNLTSKMEKDVTDSPKRESSSERDKKHEETSVRSPKNLPKRGKKGVDSLLEKLEGGNKKLGGTENIGSVIVMPVEEKDTSSVKSMSPERQKSKSPNREDEVVSPAFSNDDSNDNTKQRRKRKLEKPVRLSKDSKTEVEDMELEPTEPTEPRTRESIPEEVVVVNCTPTTAVKVEEQVESVEQRLDEKINDNINENENERDNENEIENENECENNVEERNEENQPVRRRRSSESSTTNSTSANQRVRRKSSDDATEFSKVTSPKAVNNTNPFNEVESELEKMFAGIVETEPDVKKEETKVDFSVSGQTEHITKVENIENNILQTNKDTQNVEPTDVSSTVDAKLSGKKGKKGKVQGGKRKISRSTENIFGNVGSESPQKDSKKRRTSKSLKKQEFSKKVKKNTKIEGYREMAYDSGSNASSIRSRGPVVHVEGPRDSPLSIQVVNAPREEEEEKNKEKRKTIGNGNAGRSKRLSHQNDLDYRGKVSRAGLFSSTLSSRYDAHTTDSTWVCVFCKQGPHSVIPGDPSRPHPNLAGPHIAPGTYTVPAGVLSDLFGPYLIGKERLEDGILSADEQEITTEQKKGGKNKRSLRYAGLADQFSAKMSKKKRNSVESNTNAMFTGMTVIPGEEQRWEVWLHEQCAVWAAGVYMAGGRVTGLQEAVWDAAKSVCDSCGLTGANIGCVKRGCKAVTHYPCALTKGWHLDMNQYIPKCNLHRVT
ncbi:uncharacterized protein LOC124424714 isoform X2 [Vespa crabro]|uniref:uncharacterized protein LOC124424714 isoform X2 n=1 Tax=Vespa crabro TaxID=7445 RepID=UPI001F02DD4D|nr:uncharacterized protein LOC124424714 isoform X2 [Vespa crabro]